MSFATWLTIAFVLLLIITIALAIGWYLRNNNNPPPTPPNAQSAPLGWGKPTPGPNSTKNFCQLYEFPTSVTVIDGVKTAIPGNPTFNSKILDNLKGVVDYPLCLDQDQIMAQQVQHGCTAPAGIIEGQITRCFLLGGGTTGLGGTEAYYTNVGCPNISPCAGQLSLVSINFQIPTQPNIYCVTNQGPNNNASMFPCDPSNPSQLFRITRINPGQNPNTLQPGQGQNGLIAQILDRNTGLCLLPGNGTSTTHFDPEYIGVSGCSGPGTNFSGTNLIMGECTGGIFPGYVWALVPSLTYCPLPEGCGVPCSGCVGCVPTPSSNFCGGCPSCTGNYNLITPPQIVYIGDIDLTTIPLGTTGYNGLTGDSALAAWLIDNDAESLYYGGDGNPELILFPFGIDSTYCPQKAFNAQYLNLTTYNTINQESVCLAQGTLGTPTCTGL